MNLLIHHRRWDFEIICPRICRTAKITSCSFENFLPPSCSFEYWRKRSQRKQDLAHKAAVERRWISFGQFSREKDFSIEKFRVINMEVDYIGSHFRTTYWHGISIHTKTASVAKCELSRRESSRIKERWWTLSHILGKRNVHSIDLRLNLVPSSWQARNVFKQNRP
jgi:hypothetical protein